MNNRPPFGWARKVIFLAVLLLTVVFEATTLNYFRVFDVKPNLLLLGTIIASLVFEANFALFFSVFSGILKDIFSSQKFAFNALLFVLWSFLIIRISKKISIDNNLIRQALVLVIVVLHNIITRFIFIYLGKFVAMGIFLRIAFLESIYTLLVSLLIFRIIKPLFQT